MLWWKTDRRILLGVSGGISAYKVADLVRLWRRAGCDVEILFTEAAERFVSPLVLSTFTGRRVWTEADYLDPRKGFTIPHISLADWAEAVVVAPCTAHVLGLAARGDSGTLLGAELLATRAPVTLFPAMNVHMWEHPATREAAEACRRWGYEVVDPEEGELACGYEGKGRLPSPETLAEWTWRSLSPKGDLKGRTVLVTAGPTREYLDPVRFLSNPSTGRMGVEIARTAWYRGAHVTVVCGPGVDRTLPGVTWVPVESAQEMHAACMDLADRDVLVKAAAVGDYRAKEPSPEKVKRRGREDWSLELTANRDIAADLGARKRPGQVLVGFAAETRDLVAHAREKLAAKGLDLIAANDVTAPGAGFGGDRNEVRLLAPEGELGVLAGTKEEVADLLWDHIVPRMA